MERNQSSVNGSSGRTHAPMRLLFILLVSILLACMLPAGKAAASDSGDTTATYGYATRYITVYQGHTFKINLSNPQPDKDDKFIWESLNPDLISVISVSENSQICTFKALGIGEGAVTAAHHGGAITSYWHITVVKAPSFKKSRVTVKQGKCATLRLKNLQSNSKVTWSCSRSAFRKVSLVSTAQGKCTVIAKKPGKVKVYATVDGKKIHCTVIVKARKSAQAAISSPVKGNYTPGSVYGPGLNQTQLNQVRKAVRKFRNNYYATGMSDLDKAYAAFTYLITTCSYETRGWWVNNANTAWGALVKHRAQCSGYARAYKALCDAVGVPCYYVHANSKAVNPSHQWNIVRIKGRWYIVDCQAGVFLVGKKTWNSWGLYWNTRSLPTVSSKDYFTASK